MRGILPRGSSHPKPPGADQKSTFSRQSISAQQLVTIVLVLASIWILDHPYKGIVHDSRLYTIQALEMLSPGQYAADFYFLNSYQSKFSIFTAPYALAIKHFGVIQANKLLLVAGHCLWIIASCILFYSMYRDFHWIFAFAMLSLLPSVYGQGEIFNYAETFLTPRLYSEAFVLFAFSAYLLSRVWLSLLFLGVALLFHPLMAAPAAIVFSCLLWPRNKTGVWMLVGGMLVTALLLYFGIKPFSDLLVPLNGDWKKAVDTRSLHLFILRWDAESIANAFSATSLFLAGLLSSEGGTKRIYKAVLFALIVCISLNILFVDLFPSILFTQLQLWRILWIVSIFAAAAVPLLYGRLYIHGWLGIAALILLLLSFFVNSLPYIAISSSLCGICLTWHAIGAENNVAHKTTLNQKTPLFLFLTFIFIYGLYSFTTAQLEGNFPLDYVLYNHDKIKELVLVILFGFLLLILGNRTSWVATIFIGCFLIFTAWNWDQSSDRMKFIFENNIDPAFAASFEANSPIFWPANIEAVWFSLKGPMYMSTAQSGGIVFSKEQAELFLQRLELYALDDMYLRMSGLRASDEVHKQMLGSIDKLCAICSKFQDLGHIVVPYHFKELYPVSSLEMPVEPQNSSFYHPELIEETAKYYNYDCRSVREQCK